MRQDEISSTDGSYGGSLRLNLSNLSAIDEKACLESEEVRVVKDKDIEEAADERPLPSHRLRAARRGTAASRDSLSTVAKQFDRGGKGYLDPTEMRMRKLDGANRGYLTNETVYDLMQESLTLQKQMVTQKRLVLGLAVFSVILVIATMGTAFAAATLAKDTKVTQGDLAAKDGERLGVTAKGNTYILGSEVENTGSERRLAQYNLTSYRVMTKADADDMWRDCSIESMSVTLEWTCGIGGRGSTFFHPVVGGVFTRYRMIEEHTDDIIYGSKYEYDLLVSMERLKIEVLCFDGAFSCFVIGTNCCVENHECGEGFKCSQCGCTCIRECTPEPRCDSLCGGDAWL